MDDIDKYLMQKEREDFELEQKRSQDEYEAWFREQYPHGVNPYGRRLEIELGL